MEKEDGIKIFQKCYHIEKPYQPNVVVVTLYDKETRQFGRGMSIKSPHDDYDILTGENNAYYYALRALKGRRDKLVKDPRAINVLIKTGCPWVKHSDANPILTFEEARYLVGKDYIKYYPIWAKHK